jgi:hypothetical protein
MAKIRITRTLVYEGDEVWVRGCLLPSKTLVKQDCPFHAGRGTITETSRVEQLLEETPEWPEQSNG